MPKTKHVFCFTHLRFGYTLIQRLAGVLLPPIPVIAPTTLSNYQCYNEDTLAGKMFFSCQCDGMYNASLNVCEIGILII